MAVSKVRINGTTIVDMTDATVTAANILSPYTAYGADGQKKTGTNPGGGIILASGTIVGNNSYQILLPVGKKMAETDFVFNIYLPKNTETAYITDANNKLILYGQIFVSKTTSRYDLSSDGTAINCTSTLGYTLNNNGDITNIALDGVVAYDRSISETSLMAHTTGYYSSNSVTTSLSNNTIKRDSNGFYIKFNHGAWQWKFRPEYTYNWEVIYFGTDPDNDIVEVP